MKVSELIAHLQTLPQDKAVFCQVVPQEYNAGAWSMCFEFTDLQLSDTVILSVSHPLLKRLHPEVVFDK